MLDTASALCREFSMKLAEGLSAKTSTFWHDISVIVNKHTWIFQSLQTSMQDVWHKYFNGSSKPPVSLKKYIYLSQNNLLLLFRFVSGFLTMASA